MTHIFVSPGCLEQAQILTYRRLARPKKPGTSIPARLLSPLNPISAQTSEAPDQFGGEELGSPLCV